MSSNSVLAESLGLDPYQDEDQISTSIVAIITSATHDRQPQITLQQLFHSISNSGSASLLDPLNVLPLLLPSRDPAASDLISLIGECSNAKEVIIATQEAVERVDAVISSQTDEEEPQEANLSSSSQLVTLVSLYSSAIPRLKLRKKTPEQTLRPLFSELEATIKLASEDVVGRQLISGVSLLVRRVFSWVKANASSDESEISSCKVLLYGFLQSTLSACSSSVRSCLAPRTFIRCFPRFSSFSALTPGWDDGEMAVSDAWDAANDIGIVMPVECLDKPTLASLILLAHSPLPLPEPDAVLTAMLSTLIASIQSNRALDESLSLLLMALSRANTISYKHELSPEIVVPLATILPSLASAHPDPSARHIAFQTLSLLLSVTPSPLRLHILTDLLCDSNFPQLRVAAVGLAKETVLEALSTPSNDVHRNVFASPVFLQALGPILFRPSPPDFFEQAALFENPQNSLELQRIVQCVALYYVLLLRDVDNRTGIRNADTISNIDKSLVVPLRSFLSRCSPDDHASMAFASLEVGLQRVDAALSAVLPKTETNEA